MPASMRVGSRGTAPAPAAATYGELPDRIHAELRNQIIRGRLAPGVRLVEAELALRFAVSRTPVREALARLVREYYVVAAGAGRRTRFEVVPLSTAAVPELWGIIGALEGLAIQAVAAMRHAERAALIADLERLNAELGAAASARPRDIDRVGELMTAFHVAFMDRCAGPWLRTLYDGIRPHVQRYEWAYGTQSDATYAPSLAEHREIIVAVAAANARAAKERIERHWANGAKRTVALIGRLRSRGAVRE